MSNQRAIAEIDPSKLNYRICLVLQYKIIIIILRNEIYIVVTLKLDIPYYVGYV